MRSSMVLTTSGKPRRKSAASCLAASACSAAKSSSAASRSPVWFQSSCCSLRTRLLFSCADIFVSSRSAFPDEPQHSVHDAIRRESAHPDMTPVSRRLRITDTTSSLGSGGLGSKRSGLAPDDEDHERGEDGQYSGSQERRRVVAQGDADHSSQVGGERRSDLVSEENPAEDRPHVRSSEAVRYQRHCRRHGRYVVQPEEDREYGQPRELRDKRQEQQGEPPERVVDGQELPRIVAVDEPARSQRADEVHRAHDGQDAPTSFASLPNVFPNAVVPGGLQRSTYQ